jgi:ferrous iron transport protein B
MIIFFGVFGLLEDMGYMARAAFVMDNLMHMMGLHGKSFLPLFLGFGCNVPSIMGTRVIDSKPARFLTAASDSCSPGFTRRRGSAGRATRR